MCALLPPCYPHKKDFEGERERGGDAAGRKFALVKAVSRRPPRCCIASAKKEGTDIRWSQEQSKNIAVDIITSAVVAG